jgi:hypothetical protein
MRIVEKSIGDEMLLQMFCGGFKYYYRGAAHFRDHHQAFVDAACAVLKCLSYLETDDSSPFGVRPTRRFITHLLAVAEDGCGSGEREPTPDDQRVIDKLIEVSGKPEFWGFDGVHEQGKLSSLLVRLGLANWDQDEAKVIPTEALYLAYPFLADLAEDGF